MLTFDIQGSLNLTHQVNDVGHAQLRNSHIGLSQFFEKQALQMVALLDLGN
jgi:hypothetical protein